jgi:hypothetical protein
MVSQGTLSLRGDHYVIKRSPSEDMFGCVPEVGLSTTPIPHLNDKPSDNAPENTNRNVNPVDDNNANEIPVPIDCEHECTLCNSLFQINEEDK